jgi:hypothetical protein
MAKTHVVIQSKNSKLVSRDENLRVGEKNVSTTQRTEDTCAPDCPFLQKGEHGDKQGVPICYPNAKLGRPSIFQMADKFGVESSKEALDKIAKKAPTGGLVRHLVSGDVSGPNDEYISHANALHKMRGDLQGWGYTHNWRQMKPEDVKGWTLNASTETPGQAEEAIKKGWDNVVIESPAHDSLVGQIIGGRRVVSCPNQATHGAKGCADCKLCAKDSTNRNIVEFQLHGNKVKQLSGIITSQRHAEAAAKAAAPIDLGMPSVKTTRAADHFKTGFSDRG